MEVTPLIGLQLAMVTFLGGLITEGILNTKMSPGTMVMLV